jgi:hypothetical protein
MVACLLSQSDTVSLVCVCVFERQRYFNAGSDHRLLQSQSWLSYAMI